jgi:hypothetical protein
VCCGEEKTEIDRAARRGGKRSRLIHLFLHGLSSLFRQLNSFSLANLHARFLRHSGRQISFSLLSDELRNSSSSKTKQQKIAPLSARPMPPWKWSQAKQDAKRERNRKRLKT